MSLSTLKIPTPRAFVPLLKPARYKGAHGGRGSGKSHFFAEMLVERAILQPGLRAVCIREIQKSLEQSVKRLIEDKIAKLGVGHRFRVLDKHIEGPGGGLIIFQGMQNHTADSIKSLEGYDLAWVEEAQSLSKHSLKLLRPTIRKPSSELWFTWNPKDPTDPVDELLRGASKVSGALVVEANWRDNPWFPAELREEMRIDRERADDAYDHVWEGGYEVISDSVIFGNRVSFEDFDTPANVDRFYYGADWGFANDPTAFLRSFIEDDTLYIDHEAFGHQVELDDLPALLAGGTGHNGRSYPGIPGARDWPIKADGARPETISYLSRQGFSISSAAKWPGSVEDGIAYLKAFKRIVIHNRCPRMQQEARRYSYQVDKKTDEILPKVLDRDNHGWDAVRYSLDGYIMSRASSVAPLRI